MKFVIAAIVAMSSVAAFANEHEHAAATKEKTTTTTTTEKTAATKVDCKDKKNAHAEECKKATK